MSCLLCFNYNNEDDNFSIHDFSEATKMTAMELIYKHFDFAEVKNCFYLVLSSKRSFSYISLPFSPYIDYTL